MQNKVVLSFDDDTVGLIGYDYGEQVYSQQVENKIDINTDFYVEIPDQIVFVTASFVHGFCSKLVDIIGIDNIMSRCHIISDVDDVRLHFHSKLNSKLMP